MNGKMMFSSKTLFRCKLMATYTDCRCIYINLYRKNHGFSRFTREGRVLRTGFVLNSRRSETEAEEREMWVFFENFHLFCVFHISNARILRLILSFFVCLSNIKAPLFFISEGFIFLLIFYFYCYHSCFCSYFSFCF